MGTDIQTPTPCWDTVCHFHRWALNGYRAMKKSHRFLA